MLSSTSVLVFRRSRLLPSSNIVLWNILKMGTAFTTKRRLLSTRIHGVAFCETEPFIVTTVGIKKLNLQAPCVLCIGQVFRYLQRMLFIYLINKYISLSDIFWTVHHWYKKYRQPTRCNNNGLLIIPVSSICLGQIFCPSSGALDCVLQLVV